MSATTTGSARPRLRAAGRRRAIARRASVHEIDWLLLAAAAALSVLGIVLVWSASAADQPIGADGAGAAKRHALSIMIGVVLAAAATRIPYPLLRVYAPFVYGAGVLGLLLPFTPLGSSIAGARAWLDLPGGFSLQPSEFAKIGLIVGLAAVLAAPGRRAEDADDRRVWRALMVAAPPILLVLLQNDTGTMLVMAATAFTMIVLAGARLQFVMALVAAAVTAAAAVVRFGILQQYQIDRLTAFVDPTADAESIGYNTQQARIAISGGGLWGHGLFNGPQTQGSFVPVNDSDFIYTVLAEEMGLLGSLLLLMMLGVLLVRGLRIAAMAPDSFGRLVAAGVVSWWLFQAFENIGMTLGIMPVTGVTLPLVSYGGSSVMAVWLAVGLLQMIHARAVRVVGGT